LLPGAVNGAGRVQRHDITVANISNTQLTLDLAGLVTRCSRVIGSNIGGEDLILRVGGTEIGRFVLRVDGSFAPRLEFNTSQVLERLSRPNDSTDSIEIDIFRGATQAMSCADDSGGSFTFSLAERKMYTVRLAPEQPMEGVYVGTMSFNHDWQYRFNVLTNQRVSGSGSTLIRATALVRAIVIAGQPINVEVLRPTNISTNGSTTTEFRWVDLSQCPRGFYTDFETFAGDGRSVFFVSNLTGLVNASRSFAITSRVRVQAPGTTTVRQVRNIEPPFGPGCRPAPGDTSTVVRSFQSDLDGLEQVTGSGTIRGGVLAGSARGTQNAVYWEISPFETGTSSGEAVTTVTWNLTRQ
jgi:hypothetical protein